MAANYHKEVHERMFSFFMLNIDCGGKHLIWDSIIQYQFFNNYQNNEPLLHLEAMPHYLLEPVEWGLK